jgi:hypothetical protein
MFSDDIIKDRIDEILKEKEDNKFNLYEINDFFKNSEMTINAIDDVDENIIYIEDKINSIIYDINWNNNNRNKKININNKDLNQLLIDNKINLKTIRNKEIISIIINHIKIIEEKEKKIQQELRENYCKVCFIVIFIMIIITAITASTFI